MPGSHTRIGNLLTSRKKAWFPIGGMGRVIWICQSEKEEWITICFKPEIMTGRPVRALNLKWSSETRFSHEQKRFRSTEEMIDG